MSEVWTSVNNRSKLPNSFIVDRSKARIRLQFLCVCLFCPSSVSVRKSAVLCSKFI